jgi:hypothetical protein
MSPIRFSVLSRRVVLASLIVAVGTCPPRCWAAVTGAAAPWPASPPVITSVFPPGVQRGSTAEVTIYGHALAGANAVTASGRGMSVEIVPAAAGKKRDPGQLVVKLTATGTVEPGVRELRVVTPGGVSNVGRVVVGTLPEVIETEPNDAGSGMELRRLPAVVNGIVGRSEDRDRFRFKAVAGQQFVFELMAVTLQPVPEESESGGFKGVLTLRDDAGRQLATATHSTVRPDPALIHKFESDGRYIIEVRDESFHGRREFTYRLTVGELPFITRVFPPGGKRGTTTRVRLDGINLGGGTIKEVELPAKESASPFWYSVDTPAGPSNRVPLLVGEDREFVEVEPNDTAGHATSLSVPSVANGVIDRDGDVDCYRFSASKGQRLVFATVARAAGSPLLAKLELQDDRGRQLRLLDGVPEAREATIDHTFSADGSYVIRVSDARRYGGPLFVYRLEVRPPRPDFSLTVTPGNPRAAAGGTAGLAVTAQRRDGFEGDIQLAVPNPPAGATVAPAVLTGRQTETILSLSLPESATAAVSPITVQGKARLGDQEVVRVAVPVETVLSADRPREFAVSELLLSVVPRGPFTLALAQPSVRIAAGGKAEVKLSVRRAAGFTGPVRVALSGLPRHLASQPVPVAPQEKEAKLVLSAGPKAAAGPAATFAQGTATTGDQSFTESSPALAIEVVPGKKD